MPARAHRHLPQKKSPRRLLQYFRIFFLVGVIILIGFGVHVIGSFRRTWNDDETKNIVIVPKVIDGFTGKIIFAHFSPSTHTLALVSFPGTMPVSVIGGYGMYPLQSVYPLLSLDKKPAWFLRTSYSLGLRQVIDEVWTAGPSVLNDALNPMQLGTDVLYNQVQTSLTLADKLWFVTWIRSLRPDQMSSESVSDLPSLDAIQAKFNAGNTDACSISVINETQLKGVGTKIGNLLEKSGYTVIRITDDTNVQVASSIVTTNDPACQTVLPHLQNIFPTAMKLTTDQDVMTQYRSHIAVIVGQDIGSLLKEK